MPSVVTGVRDTANILSNKKVIDMANEIALLKPDSAPFLSFMKFSQKRVRTATNPKFEWMEDGLQPRWDAINAAAGYTNADTDIVVDNANYFSVNDLVKVPRTGEVMLVTAYNTGTNTLTVTRGYGVTAAAAIVDNDPILIIGNANQEGAGTREIKSTLEVPKNNYTQIFKTPFGVTNTQKATKMYGGQDLSYQRAKKGVEHKIDIERALLFGEKKEDTSGSKPKRTTGGFLSFANLNNYDAGGALTKSEFDNSVAEVVFKYGSKEKLLCCSARMLSVINSWGEQYLRINQEAKDFGLTIMDYTTPFGVFHIMNMMYTLEGATYGGYGMVIDTENVKFVVLQGRDTKLETGIQANDADEEEEQYITECGLEVKLPETHAVITGVTG